MSHRNFIPTVWSEAIAREREKLLVGVKLCNRDYEGDIKQRGDKVKICGVARPTIGTYDPAVGIGDPETLQDQSTMLEITQSDYFNFMVDDIDRRQSANDLMLKEQAEAAAGLAEKQDSFIYSHYKESGSNIAVNSLTSANAFSVLSSAVKALWKAGVPRNEKIFAEISPDFAEKLLLANILHNTDNTDLIQSGMLTFIKMLNVELWMSTNLKTVTDAGNDAGEYIFVRTGKAISLAEQISEVEAYRPQKYFSDAVKGLQLYGAKVVRPKELVTIQVKAYGTETQI